MGGCCCSARKAHLHGTPVYYYCPPSLEEQNAFRSYSGSSAGLPTGFLVGLNLDTSSPDTYRAPPAPIPFDVLFGRPQSPLGILGSEGVKCSAAREVQSEDIRPATNTASDGCFESTTNLYDLLNKPDGKTLADILLASPTKSDAENPKLEGQKELLIEEEECCPICLEEYDPENPKMVTNCEHHFHFSCILEWMERSDCCPVCDKEMIFEQFDEQLPSFTKK